MRFLFYILILSIALFSSCSESSTMVDPEPMSTDQIVEGVNITQVFAPPTQAEVDAIEAEWAARNPVAENFTVVADSAVVLSGTPATLRIVSHTVGGVLHYGVIIAPDSADPASLPVLIYAHGGDAGTSTSELLLVISATGNNAGSYVYVAPSFRAEPLGYNGVDYLSGGEPSPWDLDVDDTIALLNATLENTPAADPERIGIVGFSRGGGVALLTAIRDPRIDAVVEFFGPTDFFGEFVQEVTIEALTGTLRNLPGLDYTNETIIQPLKNGSLTQDAARLFMLKRSAVYFAERLPNLQVHHGAQDTVVPVSEGERLIAVMEGLGRVAPVFESYIYESGSHHPLTMPNSLERTVDYLAWALSVGTVVF